MDLERKILAAAFKMCFESGDSDGAAFAHKGLCAIISQQLYSGDGSSGSVIPASVWQQAAPADEPAEQVEQPAMDTTTEVAATTNDDAEEETVKIEIPKLTEEQLAELSQADPTAPLNYLDFGEDDAEEAAVPVLEPVAEPVPAVALTPSQVIRTQTMYQILGVSQVASFEEIHSRYLRLMRKLLRSRYSPDQTITDMREFREVLRAVCVAHDILKDPVTRTDYDLRQVGLRSDPPVGEAGKPINERRRLMLGELLECAQILEPTELQVALDMHKAEPGVQFGEFLVTAGFLNQDQLDCALLAQRLISSGKITVNQFRTAMYRMRDEGAAFFDTLMVEGWLSAADIFDPSSDLWDMQSETGGQTLQQLGGEAPRTIPPEWADVPEELLADHPQQPSDNGNNGSNHEGEPAAVAAWTERDALAETQALDVSQFRSQLTPAEDD